MFIFTHTDGKTYEVAFTYYMGDGEYNWIPDNRPRKKPSYGRFSVTAILYEIVGQLTLPHNTKGFVTVPEKALRGEQLLIAGLNEVAVSKKQLRERALSNLLRRKGFSRAERLMVFNAYYAKIRQSQLASAALREAGYRREAERVTVVNG